jgi:alpha-ketoglutarate-dependent taurine dioxygenase
MTAVVSGGTEKASSAAAGFVQVAGELSSGRLPVVLGPCRPKTRALDALAELCALADEHLPRAGGVLLRGFELAGDEDFRRLAAGFGAPLLGYEFGSTPRTRISEGVYSSTEYPPHQHIPLHNEQSYSRRWPMKIWFYCAIAAPEGGETPIADSREVYRRIPERIRARFVERGLMYVRNFGGGLDVPWPQVFNTENRAEVEAYCRREGIGYERKDDGELRTRQVAQAVARHPATHEDVWFNQAHLFHVSGLEPDVREALLEVVPQDDLPRNVYYADGSNIEDALLDEVRAVLDDCKVVFPWRAGDVLMLDNMLVAHARHPFKGPRKVVVAMAEPRSEAT